ncbi:colicin E3/pyocin S6 family cytotoxin [Pseudomonas kermanshahensis]|uniref:colicin E3/pyocin S6 family cytotoxin n=1 Tax=Pseudomonas kermanshahensis TaxID=2745482 RepID=UPI0023DC04F6|nr:colicin E3/pyocin S6 family cytotoxin [Pseudomonas kermanshahensis]WEL53480.1 colicin E3/pyocin S6 family cytotoxin [Pseudomonas kermanshahensis]
MTTAPVARPHETAVAPIREIPPEDIEEGANTVDLWLRQLSENRLTLADLKTVAEFIPIANNIMAAVDAVGDIIVLTESKDKNVLDWVSLGINLIGIIPIPPTMAFARKSLRPALHLVKQQVKANPTPTARPVDNFTWYQCDQLGTPMELTDENGRIAWSGIFKAWGLAEQKLSGNTQGPEHSNPFRFQGQYFDIETNLHYNRHRYYIPEVGRFASKDPIGTEGGLNVYSYCPTPTQWVDPLGLTHKYVPAPPSLPGFPEATRARPKTPIQGGGGLRKRWKLPDGCICEWDSQHGEIEKYDRRGRHLGAFDPETGNPIPSKNAKSVRRVEP